MDELTKLFGLMEAQETRLLGIAHCIVPKEEIPLVESVFAAPAMPETIDNPILETESKILKVLMPTGPVNSPNPANTDTNELESQTPANNVLPMIISSLANSGMPLLIDESAKQISATIITTTTVAPTTTTTETNLPNLDENNFIPSIPTIITASHNENDTDNESMNSVQNGPNLELTTKQFIETIFITTTPPPPSFIPLSTTQKSQDTPSTTPSIAEIVLEEIVSQNPEPDNYIYETFSPVSKVNIDTVSNVQRTDHLVLAEEPPEPMPDDAVLAA